MRTYTIVVGAGTIGARIAWTAIKYLRALALGDRATAVLSFAEDPAVHGVDDSVHWIPIPPLSSVLYAISERPDDYPWITARDVAAIRGLAGASGDGLGASAGAGRVAHTLIARQVYDAIQQAAAGPLSRGERVEILMVVNAVGGTSRGSLLEMPFLAHRACPTRRSGRDTWTRRLVMVLPQFANAHGHEYQRRAFNALTALQLVEAHAGIGTHSFTGPDGIEEIEAPIADEVLLVAPQYQADPLARVRSLEKLDEIVGAAARVVAGLAGRQRPWHAVLDRTMDSHRMAHAGGAAPRTRWVGSANEARLWFDEERLRERVAAALLQESPHVPARNP